MEKILGLMGVLLVVAAALAVGGWVLMLALGTLGHVFLVDKLTNVSLVQGIQTAWAAGVVGATIGTGVSVVKR